MTELVSLAVSRSPCTALDIGCGPASFAIAVAQASPTRVRAIDNNPAFLVRARESASRASLRGSIEFVEASFAVPESACFDLVVCIGCSQVFGSTREAVRRCGALLSPSGTLVFADLVWADIPDDEFLHFLGVDRDAYWRREHGAAVMEACGLGVHAYLQATADSFRDYEAAIRRERFSFAATLGEEEREAVLKRTEAWSAMVARHGCRCLGFDAYVLRRD